MMQSLDNGVGKRSELEIIGVVNCGALLNSVKDLYYILKYFKFSLKFNPSLALRCSKASKEC